MNEEIIAVVQRVAHRAKKRYVLRRKLRLKKQKLNDFYTAVAEFDSQEHPIEYGERITYSPSASVIRTILSRQAAQSRAASSVHNKTELINA